MARHQRRRICPVCWRRVEPSRDQNVKGHFDTANRPCEMSGHPYDLTIERPPPRRAAKRYAVFSTTTDRPLPNTTSNSTAEARGHLTRLLALLGADYPDTLSIRELTDELVTA